MNHSRRIVLIGLGAALLLAELSSPVAAQSSVCGTGRASRLLPSTSTPPARLGAATAARILNAVRAARGCGALAPHGTLLAMATRQARRMAERRELSHHVDFGRNAQVRADAIGYRGLVAENLASGYPTFEESVRAWLESPAHRTSVLSPAYRHFGAAVAITPGSHPDERDIFWCLELGT